MGLRRALAASLVVVFSTSLSSLALAASEDDSVSQTGADKEAADRLVTAAVAERDELESQLMEALDHYQQLGLELAAASSDLDRVQRRLTETGLEINLSTERLGDRAADAYMQALSNPSSVVWVANNLEDAMVVGRTLEVLAGDEQDTLDQLTLARHDLNSLQTLYTAALVKVESARQAVEAEADHLQVLFDRADQGVASAIAAARDADRRYRDALDAAALAKAKAEAEERESQKTTTTTTRPATQQTTTSTTSRPPAGTTTTTSGNPPDRTFRPSVERWRQLVAAYFPASRVNEALAVIDCESRGDPEAYNPSSGAAGLFQFLPGTWAVASVKAGFTGASVFEPEANIASADWLTYYYQSRGKPYWAAWNCQP
ncbi:MAG TPA: transglycosylase SLT domain-containing protein [Acidimicrobiia bacterium]|jgi:peptidoglycan hydrolase CwlO-like protein